MSGAGATEAAVLRAVDPRGIATLTLNRPEKGNSYSPAMLDALLDAVRRLGADPAVRALVLRGSGRHFSAGAEIGAPAAKDKPRTSIAALCLELDSVAKPTIALVHGACIGGAVALISCCDMVIAAQNAFFSLPEVRLGFPPASLIPFFLRAIDARALRRYLLSGERFSADEALRIGLVHQLCAPDAGEAALTGLIDEVLMAGPNALVEAKGLLRRLTQTAISPDLLAELQGEFERRAHSPEAAEGRASFREKRKPKWFPEH